MRRALPYLLSIAGIGLLAISFLWSVSPTIIDGNGYCGPVIKTALFGIEISGGEWVGGLDDATTAWLRDCRTSAVAQFAGCVLLALTGAAALTTVLVHALRKRKSQHIVPASIE